jgi:hypothetical protein
VIFEHGLIGEGGRVAVELKIRCSSARSHHGDRDEYAKPTETRRVTPIAKTHVKRTPKRLYFCLR